MRSIMVLRKGWRKVSRSADRPSEHPAQNTHFTLPLNISPKMSYWNRVKITYSKEQENGLLKTITESYLLKAVSFTDAEARAFEVLTPTLSDFRIASVVPVKYADVFEHPDPEKYYEAKMVYTSLDEGSGREKRFVQNVLVCAASIDDALLRLHEEMVNLLIPYEIEALKLTPILEVFDDSTQEAEAL